MVAIPAGLPMPDSHSKALARTSDLTYFGDSISRAGAQGPAVAPHGGADAGADTHDQAHGEAAAGVSSHAGAAAGAPHGSAGAAPAAGVDVDLAGIEKVEGGKTVGEIFSEKDALSGQEVSIRGKVVKFSSQIMNKNWIHLRDGTAGPDGENDLTVTTPDSAQVGATVVLKGKVTTDQDFGFGYKYEVMMEDAKVTGQ